MAIKIAAKNEHKFYPTSFDNMSLPEGKRFCVVLAKKHRLVVQTASVTAGGKFDLVQYTKEIIDHLENAPDLDFGTETRALTVDDIFVLPELELLATEIFGAATALQNDGALPEKN
jgi:hypothetical protein